jgi:AmmeMemoRadiSam system protein A
LEISGRPEGLHQIMLDASERDVLLKIARNAITAHVFRESVRPAPVSDWTGSLAGAFVSIHKHGELRGCIGHIEADRPLAQVIAQCAISACTSDPRFPPVNAAELPEIEIELSILGPLEPIDGPDRIDIGRHGLLVARDGRRGLLLPQVATEWTWDAATFLAQTCRKAGLPADAWQYGAAVWRFEAEVFGDNEKRET